MGGKTRVYGLIANPVEHSTSPLMHNFCTRRTRMNLAYVPFKVESKQVGDMVKGAFALNILGMDVTVPHRRRVMEFLADIGGDAKAIGAVSTLMRTEHGYKGYNMDTVGLTRVPLGVGIRMGGGRCILIGAGDVTKAAAYVLAKEEATSIYIMSRSLDRTQGLAEYINRLVGQNLASTLSPDGYESVPQEKGRHLAIQPTSMDMHPRVENIIIEGRYFYKLVHTGADIVYTPARTRFMELMEGAGRGIINRLDILLYQGIIAYELRNPQIRANEETISTARRLIQGRLSMSQAKHNLVLIGFAGTGKTSVGNCYTREYGLPIIDADQGIKTATGMTTSKIFATQGEEAFCKLETGMPEELLAHAGRSIISVGGGLPLWEENKVLLKKLGCVVHLDVSPRTMMDRIGRDVSDRPMLQDGDMESRIRGLLAVRRPIYLEVSHVTVDVNERGVEEIVEEIHRKTGT